MIKIEDKGNKSFLYQKYDKHGNLTEELLLPAVYSIRVIDGRVGIFSLVSVYGNLNTSVAIEDLYINGEQCETASDAIAANGFIGGFRQGGGGVSPEDLKHYVREVPNPEITDSAIVDTDATGYYNTLGIASNGRTYFCGNNGTGIKVLNDATGEIEDTNIEYTEEALMGIASNGKTYFYGKLGDGGGIRVLNDTTGVIEETNIKYDNYFAMGIASNGRTYFAGYSGIKVLNDDTGEIENALTALGYYTAMGIASNGRTYFAGHYDIKVLNDDTGEIEDTNIGDISHQYYTNTFGIASDGKTYFLGSEYGIKVLNDDTGDIEDTNITTGTYVALGIASNGRTYFINGGNGIKVLNDDTGNIEATNITIGYYYGLGIASNGRTYFAGDGIKILNEDTGEIEDTNITTDYYYTLGIASDGRTYFLSNSSDGIRVLNDDTGDIEDTNITTGSYYALGIASNGKTYFVGTSGIKVLEITMSDDAWVRKYGEWLPIEDISVHSEADMANIDPTNLISAIGNSWTADRTGYVLVMINAEASTKGASLVVSKGTTVDNMNWIDCVVCQTATASTLYLRGVYPVQKGDIIKLMWSGSVGTISAIYCYFVPPKFVKALEPVIAENFKNYQCVPDYANKETVNRISAAGGGSWTVDRNGFVYVIGTMNNIGSSYSVKINNSVVLSTNNQDSRNVTSGVFAVAAGDVVTISGSGSTWYNTTACYFIPPLFTEISSPVVEPGGDYSTDEKPVLINDNGTIRQKKWIDGKPIFQRTFALVSPAAAGYQEGWLIPAGSGVKTCVKSEVVFETSPNYEYGNDFVMAYDGTVRYKVNTESYNGGLQYLIYLTGGDSYVSKPYYITAWYTKNN